MKDELCVPVFISAWQRGGSQPRTVQSSGLPWTGRQWLTRLCASVLLAFGLTASAQNYSVLHSFGVSSNANGIYPAALVQGADGTLYGTCTTEGDVLHASGTVFKVQPDGTGFTILHRFTTGASDTQYDSITNSDGSGPSGLVLVGGFLYGTANSGGTDGAGAIFRVNTDGTGFTNLYNFVGGTSGAYPSGALVQSGSLFYGVTTIGGTSGVGTVFKINTNGTGFATLWSFTNSNTGRPEAGLILSGSTLYGTCSGLKSVGYGSVFKLNTDGTGYGVLHTFAAGTDGAFPMASLLLSGGTLYGTTEGEGKSFSSWGTVFKVATNGSNFTTLHTFTAGSDGGFSRSTLTLSGITLYGNALIGGLNGSGVLFRVTTNGTGFSAFYSFTGGSDGANPSSNLILSNTNLYGTAVGGGTGFGGTVFKSNTNGTATVSLCSFRWSDIYGPHANLISSGSTLYGTASSGGASNNGAIFKLNSDGSGLSILYNFTGGNDGANPQGSLLLSGNTLFGTASSGGSNGLGTVFKVNTNGTGFTAFYSFTGGTDGDSPMAGVILVGSNLVGTSSGYNGAGSGAVFKVNTNGSGFGALYSFTGGNDGAYPQGDLVLSGTNLYGTTLYGGTNSYGVIFKVGTSGSGFANLYSFTSGNDGDSPYAGLLLSGNTLFGTSSGISLNNNGAIFKINTDGSGFTTLYSFTGGSDGDAPECTLVLSSNTLYGTTSGANIGDFGTVFRIGTNGLGFSTVYTFTGGSDGANPYAGMALSGGNLFGTASAGGTFGDGVVFSVSSTPPKLNFQEANRALVLSWNSPKFSLEGASLLTGPYTNVSGASTPYTNIFPGTRGFFRLISN